MADDSPQTQRLDSWLWHGRFIRTRAEAQALVAKGRVRVNGDRTRVPAKPVRAGDILTIALDRHVRLIRITGFAERRGGAPDAQKLYENLDSEA